MRITGGEWASRRLIGPVRGSDLRPTPDALREQAFAILAVRLAGCVFLDLFAGTGATSLEALSRGAARAIVCEAAIPALGVIRRNFAELAVAAGRFEIHAGPVERSLTRLAAHGVVADVVWCDPPFASLDLGREVLAAARSAGLIAGDGRVVAELPPRAAPDFAGFETLRVLRGAVLLRPRGERGGAA
ncbi:MAG: 16S rRNA (guanine(966)-N(2))-methyltransferase RsmD [Acidobacteria bacterium]|nr:16S rRNA (guanine(966)-N(2))-methyltransferase RsmD [Acidobacteriota bacterium]